MTFAVNYWAQVLACFTIRYLNLNIGDIPTESLKSIGC